MKILIVGGGYAGCCAGRLLADQGHQVTIFEKEKLPGGMAKSFYKEDLTYEYGPHIIANHWSSDRSMNFINQYIKLKKTVLTAASFIENKFTHYPPNINNIFLLKEKRKIVTELYRLNPEKVDETNFETYLISKLGITLYNLYFKNFTKKFWQVEPKKLSADFAKTRWLGDKFTGEKPFFSRAFYPVKDFNELFDNLTRGLEVKLNCEIKTVNLEKKIIVDSDNNNYKGDFIISTLRIDQLFNYCFGRLAYRGYKIKVKIIDKPYFHPNRYGIVYYPEKIYQHCRITEYKNFNRKEKNKSWRERTIITVETPDKTADFYPFPDKKNSGRFDEYLREVSKYPKIAVLGRRGLFKYTTLDTTTGQVLRFKDFVKHWQKLSAQNRFQAYLKIRGSWND